MYRWQGHHKFFTDELRMLLEKQENDKIISMVGVIRPEFLIDSTGMTLLHLAARYNNKKIINYLTSILKCKVDVRDSAGASALIVAAECKNYEAAESLLNANANPLWTDKKGVCALQIALKETIYFDVRTDLFTKKAREHAQCDDKFVEILLRIHCPPSIVVFFNDVNITRIFWKQVRYSTRKGHCINSIVEAAITATDGAHFEFLFNNDDFDRDFKAKIFQLLLHVVEHRSEFEKTQYLIYKRSRIIELFEILTKKIVELDIVNESTSTDELGDLNKLFRRANDDILQVFFYSGFVEHVKNKIGYDLRSNIFANQHPKVRESMQQMTGYDVNSRNHLGQTALHLAVNANFPDVVEKLLYMGADPNAVDRKGQTPAFYFYYDTANMNATRDCLVFLLRSDANVQICDVDGKSFAERAFWMRHLKFMILVLEPLLSKLALLTVTGVSVKQSILDCVNSESAWLKYYDNQRRELHEMIKKKIFRSLTVVSLLSQKPITIARFVSGHIEEINKALRDPHCACKESSYYYQMLNWNIKEALKISKLRVRAGSIIETNIDQLKGFSLVIDKIVEFLSYKDLIMFQNF